MHPVLPALLVFVFVLLFVFEVALGAVLVVTAFAMMRAWAGHALRSRPC